MDTPTEIKAHEKDYHPHAWKEYTFLELGSWVHLLTKRALHRCDPKKRAKDLYDAQNYLTMMQCKLDELTPGEGH